MEARTQSSVPVDDIVEWSLVFRSQAPFLPHCIQALPCSEMPSRIFFFLKVHDGSFQAPDLLFRPPRVISFLFLRPIRCFLHSTEFFLFYPVLLYVPGFFSSGRFCDFLPLIGKETSPLWVIRHDYARLCEPVAQRKSPISGILYLGCYRL